MRNLGHEDFDSVPDLREFFAKADADLPENHPSRDINPHNGLGETTRMHIPDCFDRCAWCAGPIGDHPVGFYCGSGCAQFARLDGAA